MWQINTSVFYSLLIICLVVYLIPAMIYPPFPQYNPIPGHFPNILPGSGFGIAFFVEHLPALISLAISTRADPPLPVFRLRARNLLIEAREADLSRCELELFELICEGCSNQEIGDCLVITHSTVKKHCSNIFGNLCVSSRSQAVARARQLGLID